MIALDVAGLSVLRESDSAPILDDVSLTLAKGEVMGIVGESGSGKSTLALALLAHTRPGARISAGRISVGGRDLRPLKDAELRRARRELIAYVPQDPGTALNPALSLRTQLTEGLGGDKEENLARAREVLRTVGLRDDDQFLKRKPRQLSGGQQQRIAIAMAVIARPRVVVLDEPTTGLDVSTQAKVLALVKRLCEDNGIAALYVTHDLAVVADVADAVTVMYGGQVVEQGPMRAVLARPRHPYTRALLDAVPSVTQRQVLIPIRGRSAAVGEHPAGCVFSERCDFATDACREARPGLSLHDAGRLVRCLRVEEISEKIATPRGLDRPSRPQIAVAPPVLEVRGLSASYSGLQVLHDVSLVVEPGRCLSIVGESGSGKTTLSRCLIGLHEDMSGELLLGGEELPGPARRRSAEARRRMQYVFQNPFASLNPRRTVGASIAAAHALFGASAAAGAGGGAGGDAAGAAGARSLTRGGSAATAAAVEAALERVEIPARLAAAYPGELSGGQRQRVAIARALVAQPGVLLCDEVTSALDVSVQASVIELLRSLLDDGLGMVFVTHDLAVVRSIADSVLVLSQGHVVEQGTTADVLDRPGHPYTQSLLADTLAVAV